MTHSLGSHLTDGEGDRIIQGMEGVDGLEAERVFDLEETIFVAVGKNVEKSKRLLFWVLHSFAGKKICLLYVHRPANVVSFSEFSFFIVFFE